MKTRSSEGLVSAEITGSLDQRRIPVDSDEGARQLRDIGAHRFLDDAAPLLRDDGARIVGLAG